MIFIKHSLKLLYDILQNKFSFFKVSPVRMMLYLFYKALKRFCMETSDSRCKLQGTVSNGLASFRPVGLIKTRLEGRTFDERTV